MKADDLRPRHRERSRNANDLENPAIVGPDGSPTVSGPGRARAAQSDPMSPEDLRKDIHHAAFAFRGYDAQNIGRSPELLAHPRYGPIVRDALIEAGRICSESTNKPIDLVSHVDASGTSTPASFAEDVATIVAMELVQLKILAECFGVAVDESRLNFGYSIGELAALVAGGSYSLDQLLPVPLGLAPDCAELAADTHMGVLFTKGPALNTKDIEAACRAIRGEGRGLIGPSAYLSPNTALILGQRDTIDRLDRALPELMPMPKGKLMLRKKPQKWPPLHSPLVWEKLVPNRAAVALYKIEGGRRAPSPTVLSCVTGDEAYDAFNSREILVDWTDHPQKLWDVLTLAMSSGVQTVIHTGPAPNLIPATFARISNNVSRYLGHRYLHMLGRGFVSGLNRYGWLGRVLPSQTAWLRAPYLRHVVLEDWLLEHEPTRPTLVAMPENLPVAAAENSAHAGR